jgi:hypothetical protein
MIGVDHRGIAEKISRLIPDYMVMGERGMHDMAEMEMPLPDNTLPMMTGHGQFGPIGMGGMFTTVKIRKGLARDDYRDPGHYPQPRGTRAWEWQGEPLPEPERAAEASNGPTVTVRKPVHHDHS